jgi:hypothetical protein
MPLSILEQQFQFVLVQQLQLIEQFLLKRRKLFGTGYRVQQQRLLQRQLRGRTRWKVMPLTGGSIS